MWLAYAAAGTRRSCPLKDVRSSRYSLIGFCVKVTSAGAEVVCCVVERSMAQKRYSYRLKHVKRKRTRRFNQPVVDALIYMSKCCDVE